mmetsp:Transcript_3580/g.10289  ORF Transcript_3580/g.10289 Transcript_3580/m.10289 type:complete len:200 (+) Transcript_3580:474-1073(+)
MTKARSTTATPITAMAARSRRSAPLPPPWRFAASASAARAWCAAPMLSDAASASSVARVGGSSTSAAPSRQVARLCAPAAQSMRVRSLSESSPESTKGPRLAPRTIASGSWQARLTQSASAQWRSHVSVVAQSAMQLSRSMSTSRASASPAAITAATWCESAPSGTSPSMRATLWMANRRCGMGSESRRRSRASASSSK